MGRRGSTLLEVILVVATLAIAAPPALVTLRTSAGERADSVALARAASLAGAVMEQVIADSASDEPGLGFAAFADASAYLSAAGTGLRDRIEWVSEPYDSAGLTFDVEFSARVGPEGVATGNPTRDIFRIATVTVTYESTRGERTMTLRAIVGDLS